MSIFGVTICKYMYDLSCIEMINPMRDTIEEVSTDRPIRADVPQEIIVGSPTVHPLHNGYTDGTASTSTDTTSRNDALICRSLQSSVDSIVEWSQKWRLRISPSKCEAIRFLRKWNPPSSLITIERLPLRSHVRYLGITLDTKLIFRHFSNVISEFLRTRSALYPLLYHKSSLRLNIKLLVYPAFLRPILTWSRASISQIKPHNTLPNRVLRMIVRAPWFLSIHRFIGIWHFLSLVNILNW